MALTVDWIFINVAERSRIQNRYYQECECAHWVQLAWIGELTSAIALGINLYMLNFKLPEKIKQHTDVDNERCKVREKYKPLLIDYDTIVFAEVRDRHDPLIMAIIAIKKYSGTNEKRELKAPVVICGTALMAVYPSNHL